MFRVVVLLEGEPQVFAHLCPIFNSIHLPINSLLLPFGGLISALWDIHSKAIIYYKLVN